MGLSQWPGEGEEVDFGAGGGEGLRAGLGGGASGHHIVDEEEALPGEAWGARGEGVGFAGVGEALGAVEPGLGEDPCLVADEEAVEAGEAKAPRKGARQQFCLIVAAGAQFGTGDGDGDNGGEGHPRQLAAELGAQEADEVGRQVDAAVILEGVDEGAGVVVVA